MSRRCGIFTDSTQEETLAYLNSRIALCLIASLLFIPSLGVAQSGVVNSAWNRQIAVEYTGSAALVRRGSQTAGVAFDGANIWVANENSNTVTKVRASDGACVGTCTFAVGLLPVGVAFDGANIWVTNEASGSVSKL
jgi:hypothetical protein